MILAAGLIDDVEIDGVPPTVGVIPAGTLLLAPVFLSGEVDGAPIDTFAIGGGLAGYPSGFTSLCETLIVPQNPGVTVMPGLPWTGVVPC